MADNSNGKQYAYSGYVEVVPKDYVGKQTTTYGYQSKQREQSSFNQTTAKMSNVDKQTGSYARATNKEAMRNIQGEINGKSWLQG